LDDASGQERVRRAEDPGNLDGRHAFGMFTVGGVSRDSYQVDETGDFTEGTYDAEVTHYRDSVTRKNGHDRDLSVTIAIEDQGVVTDSEIGTLASGWYTLSRHEDWDSTLAQKGAAVGGETTNLETIGDVLINTTSTVRDVTVTAQLGVTFSLYAEAGGDSHTRKTDKQLGGDDGSEKASNDQDVDWTATRTFTGTFSNGV